MKPFADSAYSMRILGNVPNVSVDGELKAVAKVGRDSFGYGWSSALTFGT